MKSLVTICVVGTLAAVSSSCARVPAVESRLQSLQFHPNMYVVQAGDTIESIARRYQLTSSQLVALNRNAGASISPGDRINVRPGTQLANDVRNRTGSGWFKGNNPVRNPVGSRPVDLAAAQRAQQVQVQQTQVQSAQVQSAQSYPVQGSDQYVIVQPTAAPPLSQQTIVASAGGSAGMKEEIIPDDYVEPVAQNPVVRNAVPLNPVTSVAVRPGAWSWPAVGEIAREYSPNESNGQGIDIAGLPGQDIKAASSGTVVYTGRDLSNSGNLVIVRHSEDLLSTYSHVKDFYVAEDDFVNAGDPIASLGWNTARESVLHFELRRDGKPVNPMSVLPAR